MPAKITHGAYVGNTEKPEHYVWRTMINRCNNPNSNSYHYYGAKGITVCKRWLKYENFIADMGERPSKDHSLDRVDTAIGYKLSNCRWATRSEQQRNKTTTKQYTNGVFTGTLVECASYLGVSKNCLFERWKNWGTLEKGVVWQQSQKSPSKRK